MINGFLNNSCARLSMDFYILTVIFIYSTPAAIAGPSSPGSRISAGHHLIHVVALASITRKFMKGIESLSSLLHLEYQRFM